VSLALSVPHTIPLRSPFDRPTQHEPVDQALLSLSTDLVVVGVVVSLPRWKVDRFLVGEFVDREWPVGSVQKRVEFTSAIHPIEESVDRLAGCQLITVSTVATRCPVDQVECP